MPVQTKTIKARIKSVGNIKKITRAMEMVAASKMRKSTDKALATREYWHLALEILANIASQQVIDHPLVRKTTGDRSLMVIISSNKGLCGGYNVNLFRAIDKYLSENKNEKFDFITIGKYAEKFARKKEGQIIGSFVEFSDDLEMSEISGLKKMVIDEFVGPKYKRVKMAYTHYVSAMNSLPRVHQLLPIDPKKLQTIVDELVFQGDGDQAKKIDKKSLSYYLFEPDEEGVVSKVLPTLTGIRLYQSLLDGAASEHSSRMMAMRSATDSANEMEEELTLSFNQARQAAITQEISEIAAGAQALS